MFKIEKRLTLNEVYDVLINNSEYIRTDNIQEFVGNHAYNNMPYTIVKDNITQEYRGYTYIPISYETVFADGRKSTITNVDKEITLEFINNSELFVKPDYYGTEYHGIYVFRKIENDKFEVYHFNPYEDIKF